MEQSLWLVFLSLLFEIPHRAHLRDETFSPNQLTLIVVNDRRGSHGVQLLMGLDEDESWVRR